MAKAAVRDEEGRLDGDSWVGDGLTREQGPPRLLDDEGRIRVFARSLATHLVDRGIRVNVVAPGPVWTPLNAADKPPKAVRSLERIRQKRPAQPEEIAPRSFFSPRHRSSYITGEVLPIIGGYSGG